MSGGRYEACVWTGGPGRVDPAIASWLEGLGREERRELGRLLHHRGGLVESRILDDWIADHGGDRRWRYALEARPVEEEG